MTDYYALLGVRPDATEEEIKRAYRRKARELHPDRTGGDPEAEARFKEVTRAYEVLRDPERRRRYDRFGAEGVEGAFGVSGFADLFDAFFGGSAVRRRGGSVRGGDAEVVLEVPFREAAFGARREVAVEMPVACEDCKGTGARPGTTPIRCPDCGGTGEVRRVRQSILGQVVTATTCGRCGGLGEAIPSPCPRCRGEGRRTEVRTFAVEIPAGVDDGSTLRLSGRGPAGLRGGAPGDLYVHLVVRPDERFRRDGADVHVELHVPMTTAALGGTVELETLEGTEQLAIPPGTQSGRVVRLRGRGVPHVRSRARGDLFVHLVVDTPTDLTPSQRELLRRLAEERGEPVAPEEPTASERIISRLRSALG
jgi:molecular chaperone DnaJ